MSGGVKIVDNSSKPEFSPAFLAEVDRLKKLFPEGKQKSALMRILHMAQEEYGWTDVPVMNAIAELLNIQPIEVYEVATFYTMFHLDKPGNYTLEICRTGPCMLVGSDKIIEHIENRLNIKVGETSADGMFTLKTAECLGACGYGPMLQCRKHKNLLEDTAKQDYYEFLTPEKVDELLEQMRNEFKNSQNG